MPFLFHFVTVAGVFWCVGGLPASPDGTSCAANSLTRLATLLGRTLTTERVVQIAGALSGGHDSMADIHQAAKEVGLALLAVKASLDELEALDLPCILHLRGPDHFVTLVDVRGEVVRVYDGAQLRILQRGDAARRMSGYALLPKATEGAATPRCRFNSTHADFGTHSVGDAVTRAFEFTNTGTAALQVTVLSKSCSCSAAVVGAPVVPPGGTGRVDLSSRLGPGSSLETVTLGTTDPMRPVVVLSIAASVPRTLAARPASISFGGVKSDLRPVTVYVAVPDGARINGVRCDLPFVGVRVLPRTNTDVAAGHCRVAVTPTPPVPAGEWSGTVRVQTSTEPPEELLIPTTGHVRGDLQANPGAVLISMDSVHAHVRRQVEISSHSGKAFRVMSARSAEGLVALDPPVSVAPTVWHIGLVAKPSRVGMLQDTIIIETDVDGERALRIPVSAVVSEPPR